MTPVWQRSGPHTLIFRTRPGWYVMAFGVLFIAIALYLLTPYPLFPPLEPPRDSRAMTDLCGALPLRGTFHQCRPAVCLRSFRLRHRRPYADNPEVVGPRPATLAPYPRAHRFQPCTHRLEATTLLLCWGAINVPRVLGRVGYRPRAGTQTGGMCRRAGSAPPCGRNRAIARPRPVRRHRVSKVTMGRAAGHVYAPPLTGVIILL